MPGCRAEGIDAEGAEGHAARPRRQHEACSHDLILEAAFEQIAELNEHALAGDILDRKRTIVVDPDSASGHCLIQRQRGWVTLPGTVDKIDGEIFVNDGVRNLECLGSVRNIEQREREKCARRSVE